MISNLFNSFPSRGSIRSYSSKPSPTDKKSPFSCALIASAKYRMACILASSYRLFSIPFRPPCRLGKKRVVGPVVFRVASLHILFNHLIAPGPEPGEVVCHLHWPAGWREEMDDERHLAAR